MRDIKFRFWDGESIRHINDRLMFNIDGYAKCDKYDDEKGLQYMPLMQYIGLKDKDGTEIYEGDIIDYDSFGRYQIKWDLEEACFSTDCIEKVGLEMFMFVNLLEDNEGDTVSCGKVIGNIHEWSEFTL